MDASGKKKYIVQLLPSYEMNIESWQPEPEGGSSPTPPPLMAWATGTVEKPLKCWQLDLHLIWRQ